MSKKESYNELYFYVGKEYLFSFLVAFVFFFFIFFVNQILVLAQKILLKNVSLSDVLMLVVLSIPQFLMYTMPFSSLASASMVIGSFSSQNEVLALRSCGIHTGRIFIPIVGLSLLFSISTLFIADRMIPYTTEQYRALYAQVLESIPTLELDSYSSTKFGNMVISNGTVEKNTVHDILIFDYSNNDNRVVYAKTGTFSVVDLDRFIYKIEMEEPQILITESSSLESYSLAKAKNMTMYLDLSSHSSSNVNITPSQMSIRQLASLTEERKVENNEVISRKEEEIRRYTNSLAESLFEIEEGKASSNVEIIYKQVNEVKDNKKSKSFNFYFQYYRTELQKKFALSFACTFLVFIAFPISFYKVKNGRLLGFGLSMFIACIYWFLLYYMHVKAISTAIHPAFFIWVPNALVFLIGFILLLRLRKR